MSNRKSKITGATNQAPGPVRVSVSFAQEDYAELKEIAATNRVSLAWVVREAVVKYLNARTPLFARKRKEGDS